MKTVLFTFSFFTQMLLSEEEAKIKAQLWYSENADFLKEQECKDLWHCVNHPHCTCSSHQCFHDYSVRREKLAAQKAAKGDRPKKVCVMCMHV